MYPNDSPCKKSKKQQIAVPGLAEALQAQTEYTVIDADDLKDAGHG